MASKQRLKELAYADLLKECAMFEKLNGEVTTRKATPEELEKYRKMVGIKKEEK